jgi:predicted AlkP superfamily phosphohydrolase/phosphomutase
MSDLKVFLMGIDGATLNLIKPWAHEGRLPAFKEAMNKGVFGDLESTTPPISPSAWTSLFTGTNPGKHGIFRFVKRKEDSYLVTPISSMDRNATPIWKLASKHDKRCIMLNIPFAYPPDEINGIMVSGLYTPSKSADFTYPKTFKKELLNRFPNYDVDFNEDLLHFGINEELIGHIKRITEEQINLTKHLYKAELWDLFAIVFRSLDVIQHFLWNDRDTVLECYQQMDKMLKWILDNIDEETILIICSDHGFSGVHTSVSINNWLEREKLLTINKQQSNGFKKIIPSAETIQKILLELGLKDLVWKLKRSKFLDPILGRLLPFERGQYLLDITWSETRAYFLDGSYGMIDINLKGREPGGIVSENEWERLRESIIEESLKLKDPKSGINIITNAFKGNEIYTGKSRNMPDIVLTYNEGYRLKGGYNYSGNIFEDDSTYKGEHEKHGVFISYGSGIKKGQEVEGTKVYDVAPTILYLLGIPISSEMDGVVLNNIFDEDSEISKREIQYASPPIEYNTPLPQ